MRGTITKRGNKYSIVVELGKIDGKRRQKWFSGYDTEKQAEDDLPRILLELQKGYHMNTDNMTVKSYLEYWHKTYCLTNLAPSTQKRYQIFINDISEDIGEIKLDKLKPADIQQFYSRLILDSELSNSTVLKTHRMFHLALKHAVGWQMIVNNPTDHVQAPRPEDVEMSIWDADTMNSFLNNIVVRNSNLYISIVLALQTGMRQGEICALRWENIDFTTGTLSIKKSMKRIDGALQPKKTKTKRSKRAIALFDATIKILKKHRAVQNELKLSKDEGDYNDQGYVLAWDDGRPYDPHYISSHFPELLNSLKDEDGDLLYPIIRFHDLRHTHATRLLEAGVNPKIVSERLGHSSIAITLDTYSHVLPNLQKDIISKHNDIFQNQA